MKKEVQKPTALMTKIEVLKFRLKNSYQIPAAHHLNMVLFKGCSKTDFVRYLNCEHRLCDEAVLLLIKAPKSEAFPLWLRYNQYNRLSPECETAYIKKFGILQLLKNGFVLSEEATLALLQKNGAQLLPEYLDNLTITEKTEAAILKLHDENFTIAYLGRYSVYEANKELLLTYDNPLAYRAFGYRNGISDKIISEIIRKKTYDVFEATIDVYSYTHLEQTDEKALIDRKDARFIKAFLRKHNFSSDGEKYLAEKGTNEQFAAFVRNGCFDGENNTAVYDRLFAPENAALLKEFLSEYRVPGKYEIRLLEENDAELIDTYFADGIEVEPETMEWLWEHDSSELAQKLLNSDAQLGYQTETKLFQSSDLKRIKAYLNEHKPCAFSEAMLFMHAPAEILLTYMKSNVPDRLAQIALIRRKDADIMHSFWKEDYRFDEAAIRVFLAEADEEMILEYFRLLSDGAPFYLYDGADSDEVLCSEILFRRGLKKAGEFFVRNGDFDEQDEKSLAAYGSPELVSLYFEENTLEGEACYAFILRGDKKLIREYISRHQLSPSGEYALLSLLDIDLIVYYEKLYGFSDYDVLTDLGL